MANPAEARTEVSMIRVPLVLGTRYARGRKRNRFGSVVAAFSLFGMALGVAALIIVLSVMNGFNREIKQRFQLVSPQLTLVPSGLSPTRAPADGSELPGYLRAHPDVQAVAPQLESYALVSRVATGQAPDTPQVPATIIGIEPAQDAAVVPLEAALLYGDLASLQPGEFGIVLGRFIARQLLVQPGDEMSMMLPQVQVTPAGIFPREKRFRVVAIFDSGSQLDSDLAYIHLDDAGRLLRQGAADRGWRLRLQDEGELADFQAEFAQSAHADQWRLRSWSSNYQSLFKAMAVEKVTVGLMLLIIVLVAAFNIVSGLVMMVSDKRADMAVLRTLGATTQTLMRIFVVQGLVLGLSGILLGALVGSLLALNLSEVVMFFERLAGSRVFDPNVFYVSFLPSHWLLSDFLWVVGLSFLLTLLATIIPAWQASKIAPTEALSYKQ